ncbi:MAG: T9SS type A sorting domain-containing protein, partial [Bacteroidia bacterium]
HTYQDTGLFTVSVVLRDSVCETGMQRTAYIQVLDSTLNSSRFPENKGLMVYPNPIQDQNHIVCESAIAKLELFDSKGALVEFRLTNAHLSYTLETNSLAAGIYLLRINTNAGNQSIRIEKK